VEDAANELINMLLDTEMQVRKEGKRSIVPTGKTRGKNTGKKIVL